MEAVKDSGRRTERVVFFAEMDDLVLAEGCRDGAYEASGRHAFPPLLTMSAVELQLDIDEFEALLAASERPNVKAVLEKEKARLEAEIKSLESKAKAASTTSSSEVRACKRVQRLRAALTACPRSLLIARLLCVI